MPKFISKKHPLILLRSTAVITCWLELHGLSPEFSLDSSILAEDKVSRLCITHTNGRMVAHLATTNKKCDTFKKYFCSMQVIISKWRNCSMD